MKKYAVISMDVEDWYHSYFPEMDVDRSESLLDGLDVALDIMDQKNIKGSFFVVGEIADQLADTVISLPIHPYLSEEDQDRICDAVRGFLKK